VFLATLMSDSISGFGLAAATIAVCGFICQIWPTLTRQGDHSVRVATVTGGILGLILAAAIVAGSLLW
jgi:hypothetical protein